MLYPITRLMVNTVEWMNTSFTYGDLKLHCRHKSMTWTFCSNFVILFSSTVYHVSNGIYTYKTVKGPASACMVEATHIKKEEEADVNLVAISCVLCDVRIYTVTVSYRSFNMNWIPEKAVWDSWINNTYMQVYLTPLVFKITRLQDKYIIYIPLYLQLAGYLL